MKRVFNAIVEDGNGKIHIFRQKIDLNGSEADEFDIRMQNLGHCMGGSLLAIYRECDVIERQNLR